MTVHNSDKLPMFAVVFLSFQAEDVTPNKLTSMAVDIASGLAYLAEMKFVHRYVQCLFYFPTTAGMKIVSLTCNLFVALTHTTLESCHFLSCITCLKLMLKRIRLKVIRETSGFIHKKLRTCQTC